MLENAYYFKESRTSGRQNLATSRVISDFTNVYNVRCSSLSASVTEELRSNFDTASCLEIVSEVTDAVTNSLTVVNRGLQILTRNIIYDIQVVSKGAQFLLVTDFLDVESLHPTSFRPC